MNPGLFDDVNLNVGQVNPVIGRGSLVSFSYTFHKPGHDPSPVVLVTDVWPAYIRGVNLHYLTYPTIKRMIWPGGTAAMCENPNFNYQYIKGTQYIEAFRQYKRAGIRQIRKLNCDFVARVMQIARSFDPNEIEAIRRSVREQISRPTNPVAAPSV